MELLHINENTNEVFLHLQAEGLSCFKDLEKYAGTKKNYQKYLKYIFLVYSRASMYSDFLELERKDLVSKEVFEDVEAHIEFEKKKQVSLCIETLLDFSFTKNERILRDYYLKQEEVMSLLREFKPTVENIADHTKMLKNVHETQKLVEKMEAIITDETVERNQGNSEKALFE